MKKVNKEEEYRKLLNGINDMDKVPILDFG